MKKKYSSLLKENKLKILPHSIEIEEAVLGGLMIDKKGLDQVIDILNPEIFYDKKHQEIFRVIQKLFNSSKSVDILTILDKLRKNKKINFCGGENYLINLTQKVISSAHIEYHSRILQQKFILRKIIEISSNIIKKSYSEEMDVFDLLDEAESKFFEITQNFLKKNYQTSKSLVKQALKRIKKINISGFNGISSGFKKIDKITYGWQKSDLIIFAGRPGMGKTAFVLSMARNIVVKQKIPVAFFSLEISSIQLITRLISSETKIPSEKLRKAALKKEEWNTIKKKIKKLENSPLFIDDTPALSLFDLKAKSRRLVSQNNVALIIIDYLQLMTVGIGNQNYKPGNREQEISIISRNLKCIAKELDIPIIALSQLSRAVEIRGGNKRPFLSDLRESGAIEQDADIVSFIYRPEYYGLKTWDDGSPCKGEAEFIIAKHRNGRLDNIRLHFISNQTKFTEIKKSNKITKNINNKYDSFSEKNLKKDNPFFSDEDFPF